MTPDELKAIYKSVLNRDDGLRVMNDLSSRFGLWKTSYTPNSDETAFREGQRSVLIRIINLLKEDKDV